MICRTDKIRIAVFGITDPIWNALKSTLNFYNIEIIAFIDNDTNKHGIRIDGIPIMGMNDLNYDNVDYIIVAALSAYTEIKEMLIKNGVDKAKIIPFVTKQIFEYNVNYIDISDSKILNILYGNSDDVLNIITKYNAEYTTYCNLKPYEYTGNEWFFKSRLISHACGGKIDNRKCMYTNSKEALEYSLSTGFKLIECDIIKRNNELIAEHDISRVYEASMTRFSIQTFNDILNSIVDYPDVSLLVDVKWRSIDEYCDILNQIEQNISIVSCGDKRIEFRIKSQIIMETYNEETIIAARNKGFECFFTQYRNPDVRDFYKTVNLCYKYGVNVIGIACDMALKLPTQLKRFTDKNIHIFVFSTDSVDEYVTLRKNGVTGVFTNYLS